MGAKMSNVQKRNPEVVPMVVQDLNLLKMVGAKYTDLGTNYTKRYDNGPIPREALNELAKHVSLEDLVIKPNEPEPNKVVTDVEEANKVVTDVEEANKVVTDVEEANEVVEDVTDVSE